MNAHPDSRDHLASAPALTSAVRAGVRRISLSAFRSYDTLKLEVGDGPVVLAGANGSGKTNLLEAISFLAPGRGLRGARLTGVTHALPTGLPGVKPWAVAAEVYTPEGDVRMGTGLAPEGGEKRVVHVDGAAVRGQAVLARHFGLVWLTPAMDRLFLEAPAARRKFLDRLIIAFDPDHAGRTAAFDRAYRQRARLFRDAVKDGVWYASLEDTMARYGVAIAAARRDMINRLNAALVDARGPFPGARLELQGAVDDWLVQMPAVDVEEKLRGALAQSRAARMAEDGASEPGPHRSDLVAVFAMPGHDSHGQAAEQCSTGEQKALLIAILLAQARLQKIQRGFAPVLLLDEIAAHLDRQRRQALFSEILALGAQAWMTGTDEGVFADLGPSAQVFAIRRNSLVPSPRNPPP
ncbi:MAG: DNA replication/repair protein RecF [Rhodospirillaceae bacterium]|nr:DNA replication/repair protein RecF [Rhodospirillaceae bacterium]